MQEQPQKNTLNLQEHEYKLIPENYKNVIRVYDKNEGYELLNKRSSNVFERSIINTPLCDEHKYILPSQLPAELCQALITIFDDNPAALNDPEVLKKVLPFVLNEKIDEHLRSYFNSEYCIFWWSVSKVEQEEDHRLYFRKWHCDSGPSKHLKVITYLNGYEKHKSDTYFLNKETTDTLKSIGYIFNLIDDRITDISPLCQHFDVDFKPKGVQAGRGDSVIFNPFELAHVAIPPQGSVARYSLTLCLLPSELSWQTVSEKYFTPKYGCQPFEGFARLSQKFTANTIENKGCIEIALGHNIQNFYHVEYLLNVILKNKETAAMFLAHIKKDDPDLAKFPTIFELIQFVKQSVLEQISSGTLTDVQWLHMLTSICEYEHNFVDSMGRYNPKLKPDPTAVYWPNPTDESHASSKYDKLPYVKKHPIMDMTTPIGSAGSCFAFEISKFFQEAGYNYVVTERNDDPHSGVVIDGYQPGDAIAKFSANYGILFNTPSFLQLAEKAFGERAFDKFLIQSENGYLLDPYRENVFFKDREAYTKDYAKHLNAVKDAFMQSKVFVITLGLNECWELHDGTVMSRNPRSNFFQLVKHKTLTVEENVHNIQRFFDIIKKNNPDFKLIISVSPIPFLATGRADEHHVISANCHSKAVLRVAAEKLVSSNADMYYLPSYELITECFENPWNADHRHVKQEAVAKVVQMFKEIFVE
jgi:hypothetical protein